MLDVLVKQYKGVSFGACLMKDKFLVRQCLESLQNNKITVSIKCRIGLGKELNEFFEIY